MMINLTLCFVLSIILTVQGELREEELLALSNEDRTFGLRKSAIDQAKLSPVQWQKSELKSQKPREVYLTSTAKFSSAKDFKKNTQQVSDFRRRKLHSENVPENKKISDDSSQEPVKELPYHKYQASDVSVTTTKATPNAKQSDLKTNDEVPQNLNTSKPRRKVIVRRKIKVKRKPLLTNDKVGNDNNTGISADASIPNTSSTIDYSGSVEKQNTDLSDSSLANSKEITDSSLTNSKEITDSFEGEEPPSDLANVENKRTFDSSNGGAGHLLNSLKGKSGYFFQFAAGGIDQSRNSSKEKAEDLQNSTKDDEYPFDSSADGNNYSSDSSTEGTDLYDPPAKDSKHLPHPPSQGIKHSFYLPRQGPTHLSHLPTGGSQLIPGSPTGDTKQTFNSPPKRTKYGTNLPTKSTKYGTNLPTKNIKQFGSSSGGIAEPLDSTKKNGKGNFDSPADGNKDTSDSLPYDSDYSSELSEEENPYAPSLWSHEQNSKYLSLLKPLITLIRNNVTKINNQLKSNQSNTQLPFSYLNNNNSSSPSGHHTGGDYDYSNENNSHETYSTNYDSSYEDNPPESHDLLKEIKKMNAEAQNENNGSLASDIKKPSGVKPFENVSTNITSNQRQNGLVDNKQKFPLMRPSTTKPKTIEATTSLPPKIPAINTYVYGKPNASKTKVNHVDLKRKPQQFKDSQNISTGDKNKNIWTKKVNKNISEDNKQAKPIVNKTNDNVYNSFYYRYGDNLYSTQTGNAGDIFQDIEPPLNNHTLLEHPTHSVSFSTDFSDDDNNNVEDPSLQSFLHFGLRNKSALPIKQDIQPLGSSNDNKGGRRKTVYEAQIPPPVKKDSNNKPRKIEFNKPLPNSDLQTSENSQHFVHIYQHFGQYAKPHINFGEESIFSENSPVNYLASLKMHWEGNDSKKAKVITESYYDVAANLKNALLKDKQESSSQTDELIEKIKDINHALTLDFTGAKILASLKGDQIYPQTIKDLTGRPRTNLMSAAKISLSGSSGVGLTAPSKVGLTRIPRIDLNSDPRTDASDISDQNVEKDVNASKNTESTHSIIKRSIRIGGRTVRILYSSDKANKTKETNNGTSYSYILPPPLTMEIVNMTDVHNASIKENLISNKTQDSFNNDIKIIRLKDNVSVVTSISATYPIDSVTKRDVSEHLDNPTSSSQSYYIVDYQKKTTPLSLQNPVTTAKTITSISTTPGSLLNRHISKRYPRKKLTYHITQHLPETSTLPYAKKDDTPKQKSKDKKKLKFEFLRLSKPEQIVAKNKSINENAISLQVSPNTLRYNIQQVNKRNRNLEVAASTRKKQEIQPAESSEMETSEFPANDDDERDVHVKTSSPLDTAFYSMEPSTYEEERPITAILEDKSSDNNEYSSGKPEYHQENEYYDKETEYKEPYYDHEKEYYKKHLENQKALNHGGNDDTTKAPLDDWTDYGVYYETEITTELPENKPKEILKEEYEINSNLNENGDIGNDIAIDNFKQPLEEKFPTLNHIPKTNFRCKKEKYLGYYADQETNCQVFHLCLENGEKHSFLCPKSSLFNQQLLICDWWHNVNCKRAEEFYELNFKMYPQRNHFSYTPSSHRSNQIRSDTLVPTTNVPKVSSQPNWSLDIKKPKSKNALKSKDLALIKDSNKYKNDYSTFFEQPNLFKMNSKFAPDKFGSNEKSIGKSTGYSKWIKENSKFGDEYKKEDWESEVTSDLKDNMQNRQKWLHANHENDNKGNLDVKYRNYYNKPRTTVLQKVFTESTPTNKKRKQNTKYILKVANTKPNRFPKPAIYDQAYERSVMNLNTQPRTPPLQLNNFKQTRVNKNIIFPSSNFQSQISSTSAVKFTKKPKNKANTQSEKQGYWTRENLRKPKKTPSKAKILTSASQKQEPESRIPFNEDDEFTAHNSRHNHKDHKDCNHEKTHVRSRHPFSSFEHSQIPKKPINLLPEGEIVAIRYSKTGKSKPINLFVENKDPHHDQIIKTSISQEMDDENAYTPLDHPRIITNRHRYRDNKMDYPIELHPVKLYEIKHPSSPESHGKNSDDYSDPNVHYRDYHHQYEINRNNPEEEKRVRATRQYHRDHRGNQEENHGNHDDFENQTPKLLRIENQPRNTGTKYYRPSNTGIVHGPPIGMVDGVNHDNENTNLPPFYFERKKIVQSKPFFRSATIGPIAHESDGVDMEGGLIVKSNSFSENNFNPDGDAYFSKNLKPNLESKNKYKDDGNENQRKELYHMNIPEEVDKSKFHIVRPYGQAVKIGPFTKSNIQSDEEILSNLYKNRHRIPSTKTGQYIETAHIRPELEGILTHHRYKNIFRNGKRPEGIYNQERFVDMPQGNKIKNSKVHFPRRDSKIPQMQDPRMNLDPKNVYFRTVNTKPIVVQGNNGANHDHDIEYIPLKDSDEKRNWQNIRSTLRADQESNQPQNRHGHFHVVRPYSQNMKSYGSNNPDTDYYRNPEPVYYPDTSEKPVNSNNHLYNDKYDKKQVREQNPPISSHINDRVQTRNISKHLFTPDQSMKYYRAPFIQNNGKGLHQNHQPKVHRIHDTSAAFSDKHSKSYNPKIIHHHHHHEYKHGYTPSVENRESNTKSTTDQDDKTLRGYDYKRIPTKSFIKTTPNDNLETHTSQESSRNSPTTPFETDHSATTTEKIEDYKILEKEAEKLAEEYIKHLKKTKPKKS